MATVELRPLTVKKQTRWGEVDQNTGVRYVLFNGQHAGYLISPTAPNHVNAEGVFHPLSGFPQELCQQVVDGHPAIKSSLKAPPPHVPEPVNEGLDE